MLFKIVYLEIGHRGNASLRFGRVGLIECRLAYQCHFTLATVGHFQGKAHACDTASDDQKIEFTYHNVLEFISTLSACKSTKKILECDCIRQVYSPVPFFLRIITGFPVAGLSQPSVVWTDGRLSEYSFGAKRMSRKFGLNIPHFGMAVR